MIREAKKRSCIERVGDKVDFILASAHRLPYIPNSFGLSLNMICIQHITDEKILSKPMDRIKEVTKNKIILIEAVSEERKPLSTEFPTISLSTKDWISLFVNDGVKLSKIEGVEVQIFYKFVGFLESLAKRTNGKHFGIFLKDLTHLSVIFTILLRRIFLKNSRHKLFVFEEVL